MEIILDRRISTARLPAHRHQPLGTRREELLMEKETLNKIWILRKFLNEQSPQEAIEFLINQMGKTKTNKKFWR
jgi:transcription termination factor Rho